VAGAAERLGITKEAVRKRISRGTLRSDKDPNGTVRVYVPVAGTESGTSSGGFAFDRDELIDELRARIEDLRTDRDAWRDQARRSDYMASAAMDRTRELEHRIRELEPASSVEAPGEPVPSDRPAPTRTSQERSAGPQKGSERVSWWRRVFR
jgi:hypothetical protein